MKNTFNDDYAMRVEMRVSGGSFVKQLGHLLEFADPINYKKLENAFPEYFAKYREMAEKIKK